MSVKQKYNINDKELSIEVNTDSIDEVIAKYFKHGSL